MIDCPYCLARIPAEASTCQHCGQQVAMLLVARSELASTQRQLRELSEQLQHLTGRQPTASTVEPRWSPAPTVLLFYVASFVVALMLASPTSQSSAIVLVALAMLLGAVIAFRDPTPNLWLIAMYAFAEPATVLLLMVPFTARGDMITRGPELVRSAFGLALLLATGAFLAGLVCIRLRRRALLRRAFHVPSFQSVAGYGEAVVKFLTLIVSAFTAVGAVAALVVRLLSPT